jgi:diketogulonate reductase-like aldo/keto reductase
VGDRHKWRATSGLLLLGWPKEVHLTAHNTDVKRHSRREELLRRSITRQTEYLPNFSPSAGCGKTVRLVRDAPTAARELKHKGLIRHIGLSNISPKQLAEAQAMTEIVCVQNFYNVAQRNDDAFIDDLAAQGIAYVPFFPLGGFTPLQSSALDAAAASLDATPMQVALAWLLQRSSNILLIPGTSSLTHLRENLQSSLLQIPPEVIADLDAIDTRLTSSTSRGDAAVHRRTVAPARKDALPK